MEENKNNTQKQPEQKKKKKSDVLLTIALIVAIAVFCYAIFTQNTKKVQMNTIRSRKWQLPSVMLTVPKLPDQVHR